MNQQFNLWLFLFLAGITVLACKGKGGAEPSENQEDTSVSTEERTMKSISLEPAWETDTTLKTPESVYYDEAFNILYVSCIGAVPPDAKDGDGYIAKVGLNGKILDPMWVKGLDGPKGMGKSGNLLYVADITRIVAIDVETGQIMYTYDVEGSTFLNDITVDVNGKIYISDSNTSTVYVLGDGKVQVLLQDDNLGGPNGLLAEPDRIITASFGSGHVFTFDKDGSAVVSVLDSLPGGDGVVKFGNDYLISNWNGEVYSVTADWHKNKILDTKSINKNAADIEIIPAKNLLLVPTFFANSVAAYNIVTP
ncbi:MAG: hypothetical protein KDC53_03660 [Saprospiraceae bacterium]|nr:hypothetical protein [Saprospiraceae bacterium]